jgi:hypothetical protein
LKLSLIKFIFIAAVCSCHSYGHPPHFNQEQFYNLTTSLLEKLPQNEQQVTQASPFYVIVVTRSGTKEISKGVQSQIYDILNRLITTKQQNVIQLDLTKSLGIVVFNEYFFSGKLVQGTSSATSENEACIGKNFSEISPRFIFAINSLSCSKSGTFLTGRSVPLNSETEFPISPENLLRLANSPTYPNYLGAYYNKPIQAPLVRFGLDIEKIQKNIHSTCAPYSQYDITNRTIFWQNGIHVAQYCKGIYEVECDTEIERGAYYFLGDQEIVVDNKNPLGQAIKDNFDVQICADHQYAIGLSSPAKNFQILQSNTCTSCPKEWQVCNPTATSENRQKYENQIREKSPQQVALLTTLYPSPYFIHANGGVENSWREFSYSMFQKEGNGTSGAPSHYLAPIPAFYFQQIKIEDVTINIEVYKIQ